MAVEVEVVNGSFPRNQIVRFGGLPALDAIPSRASWDLRENAAAELERLGAPIPPGLTPDDDDDAERLTRALADPGSVAWWLPLVSWTDGGFRYADDHLRRLAQQDRGEAITALVIGGTFDHGRVESDAEESITTPRPQIFFSAPGDPYVNDDDVVLAQAVEALTRHAADFPNLRALFVGEIDDDQQFSGAEVDVDRLLQALPQLTELVMCAQLALRFRLSEHAELRRLAFHGMLRPEEIRGIATCRLPALEHLELWASDDFGDSQDPDERSALHDVFHSATMPRLSHLGLHEFTFVDQMVEQLADSPLLPRLHSLDLSHSLLTDKGAETLLNTAAFRGLTHLGLRRHVMTPETAERVHRTFTEAGVDIDTRDGRRSG